MLFNQAVLSPLTLIMAFTAALRVEQIGIILSPFPLPLEFRILKFKPTDIAFIGHTLLMVNLAISKTCHQR